MQRTILSGIRLIYIIFAYMFEVLSVQCALNKFVRNIKFKINCEKAKWILHPISTGITEAKKTVEKQLIILDLVESNGGYLMVKPM